MVLRTKKKKAKTDEGKVISRSSGPVDSDSGRDCEAGFSLIEVVCALVIILIALLGVVFAFTYAITYNAGNSSRSQCLAVLQQEVEQIRAAQFTCVFTD